MMLKVASEDLDVAAIADFLEKHAKPVRRESGMEDGS
jgi:hypothetical protein